MIEQDYWFARSRRPGSNRMAPINAKGWFVVLFFVACMMIGAGLFGVLMFDGKIMAAVVSYALFALIGAGTFIWLAQAKGDRTRTVDDYRAAAKPEDLHDQLGGRR
ncbi:MAG: hypothetical protein JSS00_11120 [Proteobacteria bacterium]|nr:hypothetical protein [Pseudomonadota bacterium]